MENFAQMLFSHKSIYFDAVKLCTKSGFLMFSVNLPWYVRVNTIKTTISDVCHHFKSEGFTEYSAEELTNEG